MAHQPRLIKEEALGYQIDEDQKSEYRERLRQELQDPEFRQIEGFPIGEDEDILALSDPPYYTACPNPFLPEIIKQWQVERAQIREELDLPADEENGTYHREPFASDVSEGKSGALYRAHSYHTKVPHKALMRYILHYTNPGDIVLDGFCGTGMTGVAAQLCGDQKEIEGLGYHVDKEGAISSEGVNFAYLGARKVILNDLAPIATFISYNYNTPMDVPAFELEAKEILRESEQECRWMYETWHPNEADKNRQKARVNYIIWSDVFICQQCSEELVYWEVTIDQTAKLMKKELICPNCKAKQKRKSLDYAWINKYDPSIGKVIQQAKRVPVAINYTFGKSRLNKHPDSWDLQIIQQLVDVEITNWHPAGRMPPGDESRRNDSRGVTHAHHYFTRRNLLLLANIWSRVSKRENPLLKFCFTAGLRTNSLMASIAMNYFFHGGGGAITNGIKGTLYIPSLNPETPALKSFPSRVKSASRVWKRLKFKDQANSIITCQSSRNLSGIADNSIDYIFVDPPFGSNLMYSELNYFWESWLNVLSNNSEEVISNRTQKKGLPEYQHLMEGCFIEFFRVLKPGRWITVEFHNSQNVVWNSIHEALLRSSFVVADVRTLDKKQGSFKQINSTAAVKQDLVITAYRPLTSFESNFLKEAGTTAGAWEFIEQHLNHLPIVSEYDNVIETLSERQDYLLFDRMVAFHIQRGASIPMSANEFYTGLRERFIERDGMFFLPEQVPEYDKARLQAQEVAQLTLFVTDEKSSIQWLRQQLAPDLGGHPQTYQDMQPKFLKQLHQLKHEALPELSEILEQNFLQDDQGRWYVPDPNKASDLEKLRQRALLREFNEYLAGGKKLKVFRTEAVRAGFAQAWSNRDFATIVQVAEQLPERIIQEDPDLLMYYDNASLLAPDAQGTA